MLFPLFAVEMTVLSGFNCRALDKIGVIYRFLIIWETVILLAFVDRVWLEYGKYYCAALVVCPILLIITLYAFAGIHNR